MKIYEAYLNEKMTYYIAADSEAQAEHILKIETGVKHPFIDEIDISSPRVFGFSKIGK